MKTIILRSLIILISWMIFINAYSQELAKAPQPKTHTRWISPENPTGAKGKGGLTNKGAKGNAFFIVPPGQKQVLFDVIFTRNARLQFSRWEIIQGRQFLR